MANEPLRGVAPQMQVPRPAVSQPAAQAPAPAAATQQVAPEVSVVAPATPVEPMRERTQENFDKLLESNNRLFQQQQAQSVMIQRMLQQQQAPQQPQQQPVVNGNNPVMPQPQINMNDFIFRDPITGDEMIDREKLTKNLSAIQQEAMQAREMAMQAQQQAKAQEKDRQEREAFTQYPELNPRSQKYDGDFNKKTRAFLTDSMLNPEDYGGRSMSFREAADLVRAGVQPTQQQVAQAATVAQVIENQPQQAANAAPTANQIHKEQASTMVPNQPPQAQAEITADELRGQQVRTRMGDDTALAERLKFTDHIFDTKRGSDTGQPL